MKTKGKIDRSENRLEKRNRKSARKGHRRKLFAELKKKDYERIIQGFKS